MSNTKQTNTLRLTRAPHGSKRGWKTLAAQVPQDTYDVVGQIAASEQKHLGDLVHEAVALLIASRKAA